VFCEGHLFVISAEGGPLLTCTVQSSQAAGMYSSLPTIILNSKLEGLPWGQVYRSSLSVTLASFKTLKKPPNPNRSS